MHEKSGGNSLKCKFITIFFILVTISSLEMTRDSNELRYTMGHGTRGLGLGDVGPGDVRTWGQGRRLSFLCLMCKILLDSFIGKQENKGESLNRSSKVVHLPLLP